VCKKDYELDVDRYFDGLTDIRLIELIRLKILSMPEFQDRRPVQQNAIIAS
jgi:hypothetical protein